MNRKTWVVGVWGWLVLLMVSHTVWGGLNNGFDSDYTYTVWDPAEWGGTGLVWDNGSGWIGEFIPPPSGWSTITFSGVKFSDARCFLAKADQEFVQRNIQIDEYDSTGTSIKSVMLSSITPVGGQLMLGNIRFSKTHPGSLFVAATTNLTGVYRGVVWEIDLDLTTLKNKYVGPVTAPPAGPGANPWCVNCAINERDGALYMVGQNLGETTENGKGDLVAFDTSGGSTSSYTTLIDGATAGPWPSMWPPPDPPYVTWLAPGTLAFRSSNPDDGTPTIMIGFQSSGNWLPTPEFYLDTTAHPVDAEGNLQLRNDAFWLMYAWNGQEDPVSGNLIWAAVRGGMFAYAPDDSVVQLQATREWVQDADSPPFNPCHDPVFDMDGDGDVDQEDFAVFQLCYTGDQPGGTLTFTCRCLDYSRDGDVDGQDFADFVACASGPGVLANKDCDE